MALNLNIGILGHVDSGKTSLAKALSEIASTACFDKNPQSQSRGITLDLGFSSFSIPTPEHIKQCTDCERIQFTLVDCPGHASLIRTIIGGAQIIDMMLLVVDVTKGIQTQTAECLVIGELLCNKMIVVLNKVDLIEDGKRAKAVEKMAKKIQATLKSTKFSECPLVSISACPNGSQENPTGIDELIKTISEMSFVPRRKLEDPFLFAIDHCFGIKGHGTVMTGTILQGTVQINDEIEIPSLHITKKVKSMQMFKKQISKASQGDRLGICVTQFDPKLLERGIASFPGHTSFAHCIVINVKRIKYFKQDIKTKSKFHVTIGHETCIANVTCFSCNKSGITQNDAFDFTLSYNYEKELSDTENAENCALDKQFYLLLEFDKPVLVVPDCTIIGSKLDMDMHTNSCRLAFSGKLLAHSKDKDYKSSFLPKIKLYKTKQKAGTVERYVNENEVIVKNLFKKETNLQLFVGLKVTLAENEAGRIDGSFGQSGKVKVCLDNASPELLQKLKLLKQKDAVDKKPIEVSLKYKHNVYNVKEKITQ